MAHESGLSSSEKFKLGGQNKNRANFPRTARVPRQGLAANCTRLHLNPKTLNGGEGGVEKGIVLRAQCGWPLLTCRLSRCSRSKLKLGGKMEMVRCGLGGGRTGWRLETAWEFIRTVVLPRRCVRVKRVMTAEFQGSTRDEARVLELRSQAPDCGVQTGQ